VAAPLTDIEAIEARHDAVAEILADVSLGDEIRELLRRVYDVERLIGRVTTGRASPRDLSFLNRTLRSLPALKAKLTARKSRLLAQCEGDLDLCPELRKQARCGVGR